MSATELNITINPINSAKSTLNLCNAGYFSSTLRVSGITLNDTNIAFTISTANQNSILYWEVVEYY